MSPKNPAPGHRRLRRQLSMVPLRRKIFHSLDGYTGIESVKSWAELEQALSNEDEGVLKDLFRKIFRRGGLPKSNPALARKLVAGLQSSIAEFAER